ncbi:MAG: hypothetical protein IM620_17540, partial [Cytophagales bacterium]|nr:hypothetical protein [Cytophagales bacterium]
MPFNSIGDYISKYDNGNWWTSYYIREQSTPAVSSLFVGRWIDYSGEGSGTPNLYLSGNPLTATPVINNPGNSLGLYTGPVPAAGQTKHLHSMFITPGASGTSNMITYLPMSFILCDYLMYYTGITMGTGGERNQLLNNTQTLPRYTDGDGVMAFLVTQNLPAAVSGASIGFSIGFTNSQGNEVLKDNNFRIESPNFGGQTSVSKHILSGSSRDHASGTSPNSFTPFIPLGSGNKGIRRINSISFNTNQMGGTCAIILCKPIAQISLLAGGLAGT